MSGAATIERAAAGELPPWARVGPERLAHIRRVAGLMAAWAGRLRLSQAERTRWLAAAWLHDALRDAEPSELRAMMAGEPALPDSMLHGPAAALQLAADGVTDRELLDAVKQHTLGHESFRALGRALYLADFLEPGRPQRPVWRAALRARMPEAMDRVVVEVAAARIAHTLRRRHVLSPETAGFWNALVREGP
jgi:HD superfamily phosphohydrolase YqeK